MHELSLTKNVVQMVTKYAKENQAIRVHCVYMDIGEMRDVVEDLMQQCFQYLCRGTIVEGARLVINFVPFQIKCEKCGNISLTEKKAIWGKIECPNCHSSNVSPYTGQEFTVRNIEIQTSYDI